MIHTLNLSYNIDDAVEYLDILNSKFDNLHWWYTKHHCDPRGINDTSRLTDIHGWGLQTIYDDKMFPYHIDIDPHDEGPEFFKDTDLVFGFFKNIKDQFVDVYRSFLLHFPPGHYIGNWEAGGDPHGKIFIPIVTNSQVTISSFNKEETQTVELEVGKIYFFDMTKVRGEFKNSSDKEISFIIFKIPENTFNHVLTLQGKV
jgi:hypothetical protein